VNTTPRKHQLSIIESLRLYLDHIGQTVGVSAARVLDTFQRLDRAPAPVVAGNLIAMAENIRVEGA